MYVEEKTVPGVLLMRKMITVLLPKVASDATEPYAVTDKAYAALLDLVTDICKRNGIKKLLWKGDKSLIGKVDKQNMTVIDGSRISLVRDISL